MKGFIKDPDATLDYAFDWSQWLGTDTISTSTWVVESPLSIVPASETFDATSTRVFVTGGDLNGSYILSNRITTNGSRTDDRSIEIKIRNR
jgi:hypothetical protein